MSAPIKRDLLKPLAEEARKADLKIGWYHSILDWHHPDYLPRGDEKHRPWDKRPTDQADFNRYLEYMKGQLRELLTNYGDIAVVWFDGGWEHTPEELHSSEVVGMIRALQPNTIINNRIQIPQDFDTPEQYIPATGIPGRDWEVCMTMNDTWGFKRDDQNWKSTEDLLRKLVDIVSKGGNFLLNVGPTAEGLIPDPSIERLAAIGEWIRTNGESVYGTQASPFRRLPWGRATAKAGQLYLHVFDWPSGPLVVPGFEAMVTKAYLLADPSRAALPIQTEGGDLLITLPSAAPDPVDSVVVLELDGAPKVDNSIRPGPDGSLTLEAEDADIHGKTVRYEHQEKKDCIGFWTDASDWISWDIRLPKPGHYAVELAMSCGVGSGGSRYAVSIGGASLTATVAETGDFLNFTSVTLGSLTVPKEGHFTLSVKPITKPGLAVMDLRRVVLKPIEEPIPQKKAAVSPTSELNKKPKPRKPTAAEIEAALRRDREAEAMKLGESPTGRHAIRSGTSAASLKLQLRPRPKLSEFDRKLSERLEKKGIKLEDVESFEALQKILADEEPSEPDKQAPVSPAE